MGPWEVAGMEGMAWQGGCAVPWRGIWDVHAKMRTKKPFMIFLSLSNTKGFNPPQLWPVRPQLPSGEPQSLGQGKTE